MAGRSWQPAPLRSEGEAVPQGRLVAWSGGEAAGVRTPRPAAAAASAGIRNSGDPLADTCEGLGATGQLRTRRAPVEPTDPPGRLTSPPAVRPRLAVRMRAELGITTRDEAERAARAGRLQKVGVGPKRLRGLLS